MQLVFQVTLCKFGYYLISQMCHLKSKLCHLKSKLFIHFSMTQLAYQVMQRVFQVTLCKFAYHLVPAVSHEKQTVSLEK